jgi:hypothetical protein
VFLELCLISSLFGGFSIAFSSLFSASLSHQSGDDDGVDVVGITSVTVGF